MRGLSVGIIGMGGAGRSNAARFARHTRVERVVGFDVKPVRGSRFPVADDLDPFLDSVDAVCICSPDETHADYIGLSLERGKHVLVEKPMVTNTGQTRELDNLVERHRDLRLGVMHQMRHVPAFRRAGELIESGTLGKIFYVEANYWHDMRRRNTLYDDWRVRDNGQSIIFGAACHPLDLLLHLVGEPVTEHSVFASKNAFAGYPASYTSATVLLKFAGGVVGKCHANNCAVYPQMNNLVVLGDEGSYIDGMLYRDGRFRSLIRCREVFDSQSRRRHLRSKLLDGPLTTALTALSRRLPLFRNNPFSAYNHEAACRAIIDNFVDAVLHDRPVLVGFSDGRRVVELCEALEHDVLGARDDARPRLAA